MRSYLLRLLFRLFRRYCNVESGTCANRWWATSVADDLQYTMVCRDTSQPDGYSREELVKMLQIIREQEKIMGWKVPETL